MKYSIGDRVKIREDLQEGYRYPTEGGRYIYEIEMHSAAKEHNYEATILDIMTQNRSGRVGYKLDILPERPYYCDAMIEKMLYKTYDCQSILQFLKEGLA